MSRVGFIGYGSMGSMLVRGFLTTHILAPEQVMVSTRNPEKLAAVKQSPGVAVTESNAALAAACPVVFLCVKPLEVKSVLEEIKPELAAGTHLVSIAASLTIGDIETVYDGPVTKVIPSLTAEVREGISLVCHNSKVSQTQAGFVENLLSAISTVQIIAEENFEAGADLTSCAPGLIAAIFQQFVAAGVRHSTLSQAEAERMVLHTLSGTAKLLLEKQLGFDQTITRVATKGGITEEGVTVLRDLLPATFDQVFTRTLGKHQTVKKLISDQFSATN